MARVSYRDFESKSNPQFLVTPSRITASWSVTELVLLAPLVQHCVNRVSVLENNSNKSWFWQPKPGVSGWQLGDLWISRFRSLCTCCWWFESSQLMAIPAGLWSLLGVWQEEGFVSLRSAYRSGSTPLASNHRSGRFSRHCFTTAVSIGDRSFCGTCIVVLPSGKDHSTDWIVCWPQHKIGSVGGVYLCTVAWTRREICPIGQAKRSRRFMLFAQYDLHWRVLCWSMPQTLSSLFLLVR